MGWLWTGSIWLRIGTLVKTVMNLRVPQNAGKFLSSCTIGGFSSMSEWVSDKSEFYPQSALRCFVRLPVFHYSVGLHNVDEAFSCDVRSILLLYCWNVKLWAEQKSVAHRSVATERHCKQRSFLGNGSVNTFPLLGSRFLIMQQLDYNSGNRVFLRGPCRDVISNGENQSLGSSVREAVNRGPERVRLKNVQYQSRCQGTADEDTAGWKKA
jgi:hypothetical protein